jgi:large subunit ribosomal protein L29
MKATKLRELDGAELKSQVGEMEEKLFRLRFQMSMGQFEGLKNYRNMRRDRARVLGILRERELDPAKAQAAEEAAARNKKPAKRGKKG